MWIKLERKSICLELNVFVKTWPSNPDVLATVWFPVMSLAGEPV